MKRIRDKRRSKIYGKLTETSFSRPSVRISHKSAHQKPPTSPYYTCQHVAKKSEQELTSLIAAVRETQSNLHIPRKRLRSILHCLIALPYEFLKWRVVKSLRSIWGLGYFGTPPAPMSDVRSDSSASSSIGTTLARLKAYACWDLSKSCSQVTSSQCRK